MKTKQIWTLLIILAVLAGGAFLRQMQKPAQLATEDSIPLNLSFSEEQIQKIAISRSWNDPELPPQKIEIERKETGWILPAISGAPANLRKIEEFFRQIREAQGEQRAQGKDFFEDFGIEDPGSYEVSLYSANGKSELEFLLGLKTGSGGTFLRKKGSDAIYVTETNFFPQMGIYEDPAKENLSASVWAGMDFLKLETDKVRGLEIKTWDEKRREKVKTSLEFKDGKWKFKNPGIKQAASEATIKDFLAGMATWTAEKIFSAEYKDFSAPVWQMTVFLDDGKTKVFKSAGRDKETEAAFLQGSDARPVYQLSKYNFENLDKDDTYFQEAPAPAAPASAKK